MMRDVHLQEGDGDEQVCVDYYPEHDYREMDRRDGVRTLECRRCGAETEETVE